MLLVIEMSNRIFYIFEVKKEIKDLYLDSPYSLFKIFNSIYYMHKEDVSYGFTLLSQLVNKNNKLELNNKLYIKYHDEMYYSKIENEHIINDIYRNEVSILKVNKYNLVLESNKNYSSFLEYLLKLNNDYFVCDFLEQDFFFISDIKKINA